MTLESDAKFEGKLTFAFKNDMKNLRNFHQSNWKSQNLYFDGILLSKAENAWAWDLSLRYNFVIRMTNSAKMEEKLMSQFKTDMKNLTNFDSSTQKSQIFTL